MANVRRLARNISVDISTDNATWLNLPGRVDNNPALTPTKKDSTDVDTDGFGSQTITLVNGVLTVKYNSLSDGGTPNPAQELVEGCEGQFGDNAMLYVRWYDNDGGSNGHTARSIVEIARADTAVDGLRAITATFTLDGTITKMTSGDITAAVGSAALPVVTAASPSAVAAGGIVEITGQHFTGATSAKFGATAATSFIIVSDSKIVAVMPAGSAGAAAVTVITAAGTSNALAYTRGA